MGDNVGITPGSGAKAASREVSYSGETAQMQVVGLATLAGADDGKTPTDVSEAAPLPVAAYGELVEAIEAMRMAIHALTRSVGLLTVDPATGRLRAEVVQATAASLLATVSISSNQTLSTLSNQTQMGGLAAQDQIPALMRLSADNLRRNISVN